MKSRPWYRVWPEFAALILSIGWIPFLPRRAVLALARLTGAIGFRFAKKLRRVGRANLDLVFADSLSPAEKDRLLKKCFQHFALLVLDIIWFTRKPAARMATWIHWQQPSTDILFQDQPQLLLTAHYGNWEAVGQAYAARGQPLMSVAAPLKNPPVDRLFLKLRQQTGQSIIPQRGAARKLLQGLRQHRKLAVLLDQNTRPRDGGIFVDFFGIPVPVSSAPAALALKTNAPVITVLCVPDNHGHYTVTVHDILHPDPAAENPVHDLTGRMTRSIEHVIRNAPEYWCWMYPRWRIIPENHHPATYPPYARPIRPRDYDRRILSQSLPNG